jgi:hypothetical protein
VCCGRGSRVHCRPPPCADCLVFGESTPAEYTCCEDKCDLKALCGAHVTVHHQWGHAVSVLVPDDAAGAPSPDTLYRQQLEVLASRRAVAVEALEAATARLHAAVDAKRAALLADIQAAYDAKVAAVQVGLAAARSAAAELATVAATAEAGVGASANVVMRVHVAASVTASLGLAQRRDGLGADVTTLGFEGLTKEELVGVVRLGRLVTDSEAAVGGPSQGQVCVLVRMI